MELSTEFCDSYSNYVNYPINLVDDHLYNPVLKDYRDRLAAAAEKLFLKLDTNADVPFRDLTSVGDTFSKKNVFSDEKLRIQLGDDHTPATAAGQFASKQDPRCRFVFLWAEHERAKLKISYHMLCRLLSFYQVTPRYLEFLLLFGERVGPNDLRYSGFREQTRIATPVAGQVMPALGRSGRLYQMSYNLKTMTCTSMLKTSVHQGDWCVCQAAICHQFDVVFGTSLWIVARASLELKERIQEITGPGGRREDRSFNTPSECFRSSLAVHMLLAYWAVKDWRWYVQYLEEVIDRGTEIAIYGNRTAGEVRYEFAPRHVQQVQLWEEKCREVEVIIGGNVSVLTAVRNFYQGLLRNIDFPLRTTCEKEVVAFIAQIDEAIDDCKIQISRAVLLIDITLQRKSLHLLIMQISQHLQSQATEEMASLSILSQKEAIAMRIITVVTLLYLPATFVSTFFSTDVVKYQNQNNTADTSDGDSTSYSPLALYRWLQVTLPLTFITLLVAWYAYRRARDESPFHMYARKTTR